MSNVPNYFVELSEYDYIPKGYRKLKKDDQAIFVLRTLTQEEQALIEDSRFGFSGSKEEAKESGTSTAQYKRGTELLLAFNMGLVDWKNFKTPDGKDIPFNKINKGKLHVELWKEIGEEIIDNSSLSKEEVENLD